MWYVCIQQKKKKKKKKIVYKRSEIICRSMLMVDINIQLSQRFDQKIESDLLVV